MKNRSRSEIISLILSSANNVEGVTLRRLMYNVYLSYSKLKRYLIILRENGMLQYSEEARYYKTTQKGVHFLQAYGKIREMIFSLENKIEYDFTSKNELNI
jgi:predicted transcriptional regulator